MTASGSSATIRDATWDDLPKVVALYADDALGSTREQVADPLPQEYRDAFVAIDADPRHRLVVAEDGGDVVATLQLSFIPHVVRLGGERAQIEAVRVHAAHRGTGRGHQLIEWAVEQARRRGCALVQLTTDTTRPEAHRFYESLGFASSHVGMKLTLT